MYSLRKRPDRPYKKQILTTLAMVGLMVALLATVLQSGSEPVFKAATGTAGQKPTQSNEGSRQGGAVGAALRQPGSLQPLALGFAPYAYVPYGGVSMADFARATGAKRQFASFILGDGCTAVWDGRANLGLDSQRSRSIKQDMEALRSMGGEPIVSFGGESGTELAGTCKEDTKLTAAYQSVVKYYGLTHLNFDIELKNLSDEDASLRRARVLASMQKSNPALRVSVTLPVATSGLTAEGVRTIKQLKDNGVTLSGIYIMTMMFGPSNQAESDKVIAASTASAEQLRGLYGTNDSETVYRALGIIVMPGKNTATETFTIEDAARVRSFAASRGIGTLSYWSANRDRPCQSTADSNATCSGLPHAAYQFARTLSGDLQ